MGGTHARPTMHRGQAIWTAVLVVVTVAWGTGAAFELRDAGAVRVAYLAVVLFGLVIATIENYGRLRAGGPFKFWRPLRFR